MFYDEEEDDIPYGLRVGKNVNYKGGSSSDVVDNDGSGGDVVIGSSNGDDNAPVGKGSQQMTKTKQQETLKGAGISSSFGSTASINGSSGTIGGTTKYVAMKGGQFQPSSTTKKSIVNTTPTQATFKKGMVESKMRKGVLLPANTKKASIPIKTMPTLVTKTPLQAPPSPPPSISKENIAVQSQLSSSSVLKSIDRNKEEIARTKSWIENEKRLDDVRKKVAEIQGITPTARSARGDGPFQVVANVKEEEEEMTTTEGPSMEKDMGESIFHSFPTNSNTPVTDVAEGNKSVKEFQDEPIFIEANVNVKQEDGATNESSEDWIQEQNRIAQQRTAARLAKEAAMSEGDESSDVISNDKQEEDATNESSDDWTQEQNRIAQQRTAARLTREKEAIQKEAAAAAAAIVEEEMRGRLDDPKEELDRIDEVTSQRGAGSGVAFEEEDRDVQSLASIEEERVRMEAEAKAQNARLNEAMKQPNFYNERKVMMETEKPRSEQIPSGGYWLAEQNRVAEERQKARLAKEATGNPLKGSDSAFGLEQPAVLPKKTATTKKFEFANTEKVMPMTGDPLQGNKVPFSTQPFMKQKMSKMERPNVEPAVSSMPLKKGPSISTALRGSSNEMRMIEKGFVPFKGTVTQEKNVQQNLQQAATPMPMIPIIKIDPTVATQMIAPTMTGKENKSRSLDLAEAEAWGVSLDDIDFSSLPVLRVGSRIRSSFYGTAHQVLLILPKGDGGFEILPCVAKRPWTITELYANVPSKVSAFEEQQSASAFDDLIPPEPWEVDYKAKSVRRYWEVEIHCNKKFQQKKELYKRLQMQTLNDKKQKDEDGGSSVSDGADDSVSFAIRVADVAVPIFYDVYPDDGSGGTNEDDIIPEYGSFGQDVWNKTIEFGHDWLVYESKLGDNELTLLDAMLVRNCNWALNSRLFAHLLTFLWRRRF